MRKYIVKTLGCKANLYDSQLLEAELQKRGWVPATEGEIGLCIVNSCTVTDEADKQTRKMAGKLAKTYPQAKIVVTGCGAEVDPEGMAATSGVHYVVGNQNKDELVSLVLNKLDENLPSSISSHILQPKISASILGTVQNYPTILSKHPHDREWPAASEAFFTPPSSLSGHSDKTRAFLKIQEGCDSFCTYCIIPYGRGPSRSLRPRLILQQINKLIEDGVREVVITGTNIGDYGRDWNSEPVLGDLLEMILSQTSIERLRVSSLDPTEITPQILSLMEKNPRFCPHFHVSLQSPHTRILRLMKRRYQFEHVQDCLEKINQLSSLIGGVFVGMDVITGFPGETDSEFDWTYEALASLPWTRLHVFPYSERSGTPATRLPNPVPQAVRVQRTKKLNRLSLERLNQHYRSVLVKCQSQNLTLNSVLMEKQGDSQWVAGYTPNYLRVLIPSASLPQRNQLLSVHPIDLMIDPQGNDVALVCRL